MGTAWYALGAGRRNPPVSAHTATTQPKLGKAILYARMGAVVISRLLPVDFLRMVVGKLTVRRFQFL